MSLSNQPGPAAEAETAAPWWRGAVIYQVYPRSFADSDGDGIGDLNGITAHLDHVASLGVDGVWLSPFFTSPMQDFGYDVADYTGVDPMFGTLEDFDRLVARAHDLGLKVVIDQVYSHTSDQHPWFQQSRADRGNARSDWYVWADAKPDGTPPNNWQSVFGGPGWTWDARRGQYYLHNFLDAQPDLDLHNPAVQDALLGVARFWLERGVDGFRLDAINFAMHDPALRDNPPAPAGTAPRTRPWDFQLPIHNMAHPDIPDFLRRIRQLTDSFGGAFTVAEIGGDEAEPVMRRYTSGEDHLNSAYGFTFLYAKSLTPQLVRQAVESWPDGGEGWPSWAFSNHDAPRHLSRWAPPEGRAAFARLAMLLLVCLRGNIFIWQGEELGLPQADIDFADLKDPEAIANWPLTLGRDGARTPMPWQAKAPNAGFSSARPWLPVAPRHAALAVDAQEADPGSQLALTRRLIALRDASPALRLGDLRVLEARGDLLVFERRAPGQTLLCAFNLGQGAIDWRAPQPQSWRSLMSVGDAASGRFGPWAGAILERLG
jgi:alpha-glucosidase